MEVTIEDWWRDELQISIIAGGRVELDASWRYDFTSGISPWRLYRNDRSGAAMEFEDGTTFAIPAATCVLLPTGLRFQTRAWTTLQHFYVHFHLDGQPLLPEATLHRPIELGDPPVLRFLIQRAGLDLAGSVDLVPLQWRLKAVVLEALVTLFERLSESHGEQELDSNHAPFRHALRYIQDHVSGPINCQDLAEMCGMSPSYFTRQFRLAMGLTPAQYVLQYRARLVAQKLASTDQTLESIASETGFVNRSHLIRVFKRQYLTSPGNYRRQTLMRSEQFARLPRVP